MMKIRHPEIEVTGESSEEAFAAVWEPRGWERVDELTASVIDTLGVNVVSLDRLSKQQLLEFGAANGYAVKGSMSKESIAVVIGSGQMAEATVITTDDGAAAAEEVEVEEEEDLEALTKEQLVDLANQRGIAGATMSKSKSDLIDLIESEEEVS